MTTLKIWPADAGIRYRERGDAEDTVIPCDDRAAQAALIERLLTEQGIVAEPVTIKYEADQDRAHEIRFAIVEAAIKDLADGECDEVETFERTRLLSPRLFSHEDPAPTMRCYRGHWVQVAVSCASQLEDLKDAPGSDAETEIEGEYDGAIEILAGIRGHGPNNGGCPACSARKAAAPAATATVLSGAAR